MGQLLSDATTSEVLDPVGEEKSVSTPMLTKSSFFGMSAAMRHQWSM